MFPVLLVSAFYAAHNIAPIPGPSLVLGGNTGILRVTSTVFVKNSPRLIQVNSTFFFPNLLPNINIPLSYFSTIGELILGVSGLVVFAFLLASIKRRSGQRDLLTAQSDVIQEKRVEMATILDDTAAKLSQGVGYRAAVLECYQKVTYMFEKRTGVEGRLLTAREFEDRVSIVLKLDSPYLSRLTELFEIAKYSNMPIGVQESRQASLYLSELGEILRRESPSTITDQSKS